MGAIAKGHIFGMATTAKFNGITIYLQLFSLLKYLKISKDLNRAMAWNLYFRRNALLLIFVHAL